MLLGVALAIGPVGSAAAAPAVGKDGTIHACYRVKGKQKGAIRIAARCGRGEKKVAWNVAGPAGPSGPTGPGGATGATGAAGQTGASGTSTAQTTALESQVTSLKVEVSNLKEQLGDVLPGQLDGVVGKLQGVSATQLDEAVAAIPVVDSLCTEVKALPGGINALRTGILGIGVLGLPGLSLDTTGLPAALSTYSCPS